MKKHLYRASAVNSVDWARLVEQVEAEPLVVAIEVAKEVPMAALMTAEKQVLKTLKWTPPAQSAEVIAERVGRFGRERLEVVMEPSGTYGDALRYRFEQAGVAVYRVSPKHSPDAQEVYDGVPSLHDAKSAYLIRHYRE